MRYLYYCATPFQVLNAMNMHFQRVIYKSTEDVHADIVIEEQFRDAQLLIDALKKESVFERVFHLKKEDRKAQKKQSLEAGRNWTRYDFPSLVAAPPDSRRVCKRSVQKL